MKKIMNSPSLKYTLQVRWNLFTYAVFGWLHSVGVVVGASRLTLFLLDHCTYKMPRGGYAVQEMKMRHRVWLRSLLS